MVCRGQADGFAAAASLLAALRWRSMRCFTGTRADVCMYATTPPNPAFWMRDDGGTSRRSLQRIETGRGHPLGLGGVSVTYFSYRRISAKNTGYEDTPPHAHTRVAIHCMYLSPPSPLSYPGPWCLGAT